MDDDRNEATPQTQSEVKYASIEERVKRIIAEQLQYPVEIVKNDMSLVGDLGADSLDVVEIGMVMEEEFEIEIPEEQVERYFTTVQSIIDYIKERVRHEKSTSGNDAPEAA
ncbi:acyl carrier protein [Cupriavidus basilensis]|uniref:Acyl carrier protein n=1 Tax=Cupriavidus basilensis TaxID=68895 RepID=A0ABT6B1I0_9BURK|nr:acyl carrier protein [Cupriavidus basilensis]MDF3838468.1 acyl carrier protein [Cupriavidus basilensis]